MIQEQLTLIQGGEFIVCDEINYTPAVPPAPASLVASTALPINTMRAISVRIDDEIVPLPFVRSLDRKAVTTRICIDGPLAARIARSIGVSSPSKSPGKTPRTAEATGGEKHA
jgi:hypothetical protein